MTVTMRMRNSFLALMLLAASGARADIHRCVIDDHITFRDRPCPAEQAAQAEVPPPAGMSGCYEVDAPGWESGRNAFTIRLAPTGSGKFSMTEPRKVTAATPPPVNDAVVPMRHATPGELREAAKQLAFATTEAVVMEVPDGTPNQPAIPIGLYKGRDPYRDVAYFFFGFLANGWAKPVACK